MLYFASIISTLLGRLSRLTALLVVPAMMWTAQISMAQTSPKPVQQSIPRQTIAANTLPANQTPKPEPKINAEQAIEKAMSRIDDNMVNMSNLVEALVNNLGQLHYLRTLCYSLDDQQWRKSASKIVQLEASNDAARKRQLIRSFNAGFYEQKERFDQCAGTVTIDVAALAENARRLSVMLGDPYREHDN